MGVWAFGWWPRCLHLVGEGCVGSACHSFGCIWLREGIAGVLVVAAFCPFSLGMCGGPWQFDLAGHGGWIWWCATFGSSQRKRPKQDPSGRKTKRPNSKCKCPRSLTPTQDSPTRHNPTRGGHTRTRVWPSVCLGQGPTQSLCDHCFIFQSSRCVSPIALENRCVPSVALGNIMRNGLETKQLFWSSI